MEVAWAYLKSLAIMALPFVLLYLAQRKKTTHPECGRCGYNLTGRPANSLVCPECGGEFNQVGIIPIGQRQRNQFLHGLGIALFLLVFGLPLLLFAFLAALVMMLRG